MKTATDVQPIDIETTTNIDDTTDQKAATNIKTERIETNMNMNAMNVKTLNHMQPTDIKIATSINNN